MKKIINSVFAIAVICLFAFFAIASSSGAETSSDGTDGNDTPAATAQMPTYKIGETVTVKNSTGEYKVKITGVKETSDRNEFSDVQAKKVILISYEYENVSYQGDLSVTDLEMKAYDKENNLLESYPATEAKYGNSVGVGRKSNGVLAYALNSDSKYVEIEYYDNMFNSSADCKFVLEW